MRRVAPNVSIVGSDGRDFLFRTGADNVAWLARYFLEIDLPFEILAPPELRAGLHDLAVRLTETHPSQ